MSVSVFSASAQFVSLEFWQQPLPIATIALSVALVSARNLLLGMSMTHHFDGHSMKRRVICLFILNDPGVITSFQLEPPVDRLSYVTGYGVALMTAWLLSTWTGLQLAEWFASTDLGSLRFAGPLVMATMMMLFIKGSTSSPVPWVVSGLVALALFEVAAPNYVILLGSVVFGVIAAVIQSKRRND